MKMIVTNVVSLASFKLNTLSLSLSLSLSIYLYIYIYIYSLNNKSNKRANGPLSDIFM